MTKRKTALQKKQRAQELSKHWITLVILLVIFAAGFLRSGLIGILVSGMGAWLFGNAAGAIIVLWFGMICINTWFLFHDKPKATIWPAVLISCALLLGTTYLDTDSIGFVFFTEKFKLFVNYFKAELPDGNGGGILGGLLYGLCSIGLGKEIVIFVIVILAVIACALILTSETVQPTANNVGGKVKEFLKRPEEPEAEAVPEEPKPVVNLWKMIDEHKERRNQAKPGQISVSEEQEETIGMTILTEEPVSRPQENVRRMINITADGPTEEILLVSIPGKTVSSRKSLFISVDDLLEEDEQPEIRNGKEPEKYTEETAEDPAVRSEEPAPVQLELPICEEDPAVAAAVSPEPASVPKRSAARTRHALSSKDKPYKLPGVSLLDPVPAKNRDSVNEMEAREKGELLVQILHNFEIESRLIDTHIGPSVTQYEIRPDASVKISRINSLTDNIKMQLAAKDIRIEAPIPGRNAIGIEVPNAETTPVKMRELMNDISEKDRKSPLLFFLGKDLLGKTITCRLDKMPHLLIAGATGSGKSVCMNSIICSLLLRTDPDKVKMLLVDPKKVEFTPYHSIPHLIGPVINEPSQASNALKVIVQKMDERYNMFAAAGVRNIEGYNAKVIAQDGQPNEDGSPAPKYMPYIVVIIDELADLMLVAGKEVEGSIQRITQLARAAGIHLIVATQRPSVNVITGVIKANIPSRIAFSVSSAIDSRTILDSHGAERLLGNGDMLYLPAGQNSPTRVQGVFVTDAEVQRITEAVSSQRIPHYDDAFVLLEGVEGSEGTAVAGITDDPMFEEVKEYVVEAQKASTSLLQRRFGIGYNRAARMIDALEEQGIIGPAQGSKPREVYLKPSASSRKTTETGGTYE